MHSPLLLDLVPDESLFVTRKSGAGTSIGPFSTWGPLARRGDIDQAMDLDRAASAGVSLCRFLDDLRNALRSQGR